MGKTDDWMPLILAAWRRGTAFMTPAERGAYMDLLLSHWEHKGLPNEDDVLQQLARCKDKEWKQVKARVLAKFYERDGILYNERAEEEKQKAEQSYQRRASAGQAGGKASGEARAKQKRSNASSDDEANGEATYQEHSPNGEKHPSDVLAKPRKRRSQIPPDWQPNEKDVAHATDRKLDLQTVQNLVEPFRDHHIAKQTLSADFSANWRTWVKNHLHYHGTGPWPRPDAGGPKTNTGVRQSVTAARDRILAKAGIQRREVDGVPTYEVLRSECDQRGAGNSGPIIDADEWRGVPRTADGNEGHDKTHTGDIRRPGNPAHGLPETDDGLSGGRGALRPQDAA